jgi:hypothetical protein
MERLSREHDEDAVGDVLQEPPAPEPVQAGSMAWASAIGNQAVQRLARQSLEEEEMPAEAEEVPELTTEEAEPEPETVGAVIDDLADDEVPD